MIFRTQSEHPHVYPHTKPPNIPRSASLLIPPSPTNWSTESRTRRPDSHLTHLTPHPTTPHYTIQCNTTLPTGWEAIKINPNSLPQAHHHLSSTDRRSTHRHSDPRQPPSVHVRNHPSSTVVAQSPANTAVPNRPYEKRETGQNKKAVLKGSG